MPWLFDEDLALKQKLSGKYVVNYVDGRHIDIATYYRFPDPEERTRTFPHIAIDMISIEFDPTRAHRADGYIQPYDLETATPPSGFNLVADDMPLPWSLIYQLACYSRDPWHDRQLAQLMYMSFPEEFGSLDMSNFDGTVRRADFISAVRRDRIDNTNKRLFCNIITIAVSSEFYLNEIQTIQQVGSVNVDYVFTGQTLVPPS